MYHDGPQVLAVKRFERAKQLGLIPKNAKKPVALDVPEWASLSDEERLIEAKRMQIYAAMIENMDAHIGRLIADLKQRGQYDNTVFFFLSDNGAAGALREKSPKWSPWINAAHNQSYENMGNIDSYVSTGSAWAQASSSPLYLFKGFTTEGGGALAFDCRRSQNCPKPHF